MHIQVRGYRATVTLDPKTVTRYLHIYRRTQHNWLRRSLTPRQRQLGGDGWIVEIDESCFVKKRIYGRGSASGVNEHKWVFGMVERSRDGVRGKCLLFHVPNRRRETLITLIERHIIRGLSLVSSLYKRNVNLTSTWLEVGNNAQQTWSQVVE